MEFMHTPVMATECIEGLNIKTKGTYVDGTLGGGGHASLICSKLDKDGSFLGIDRDQEAIEAAMKRLHSFECNVTVAHSNYSEIVHLLEEHKLGKADGILLDLGVSSFQLDNPDRGFSYMKDAPLDMRMNSLDPETAEDIVNTYDEKELTEVIRKYGEEKWASRISKFIVNARKDKPITSTGQLVEIIKAAIPASARREGPHPAKRTFQALRIELNQELGILEMAVKEAIKALNPGGRLCIITFHSLEDRIVKDTFNEAANPCICPKEFPICTCGRVSQVIKISKKPIIPSEAELEANPRARSAKLRIIEKR